MDLYLIRHADAIPLGEQGLTEDAVRPLTPQGLAQARAIALAFQERNIHLDAIIVSPLLRARQTAEEALRAWPALVPDIHVSDHLAPQGKRRKLAAQLETLGREALALIGHEPDLGELTGWLLGSRKARIKFAKASVAHLRSQGSLGKGACTLEWLVTPAWFQGGLG